MLADIFKLGAVLTMEGDSLLIQVPSTTSRDTAKSRWITVEPILFLSSMAYFLQYMAQEMYIAYMSYLPPTSNDSHNEAAVPNCIRIGHTPKSELIRNTVVPLLTVPSILLFGSLSDQFGRRFGLIISLFGTILQIAICLAIYYRNLPLWAFYVSDVLGYSTGGYHLLVVIASAYVSDVAESQKRTWRMVVVFTSWQIGNALMTVVFATVGSSLHPGQMFGIALGVYVLALIYASVPYLLPETIHVEVNSAAVVKDNIKGSLLNLVSLMSYDITGRRWKIIALTISGFFLFIWPSSWVFRALFGSTYPICASLEMRKYYVIAECLLTIVGVPFVMKAMEFCLKELWMLQIGIGCMVVAFIITGVAPSTAVLFVGLIPGSVGNLVFPVLKGTVSRLDQGQKYGTMFSFVGCLHPFAYYFWALVTEKTYLASQWFYHPFMFFVCAAFLLLPIVLLGIIQKVGLEDSRSGYEMFPVTSNHN